MENEDKTAPAVDRDEPTLKDKIVAAIETCYDPEIPVNIYERHQDDTDLAGVSRGRLAPTRSRDEGRQGRGRELREGRCRLGAHVDAGKDDGGGWHADQDNHRTDRHNGARKRIVSIFEKLGNRIYATPEKSR